MTTLNMNLELAVSKGHIAAGQAYKLREIDATANSTVDSPDDENLRFITGFADIFVMIGIGLFLIDSSYCIDRFYGITSGTRTWLFCLGC